MYVINFIQLSIVSCYYVFAIMFAWLIKVAEEASVKDLFDDARSNLFIEITE